MMAATSTSSGSSSPPPPTPCPCHGLTGSNTVPSSPLNSSSSSSKRATPQNPKCPSCVEAALEPHRQRRSEARRKHGEMKRWCAERLGELRCEDTDDNVGDEDGGEGEDVRATSHSKHTSSTSSISGASLSRNKYQSDHLRTQLDQLRLLCGERSVKVAALALRNDEREERLRMERQRIENARFGLDQIWVGVLGGADEEVQGVGEEGGGTGNVEANSTAVDAVGQRDAADDGSGAAQHQADAAAAVAQDGLPGAISSLVSEVRSHRLDLALRSFEAHRIDIGPDFTNKATTDASDSQKVTNDTATNNNKKNEEDDQGKHDTSARERAAAREERRRRRPHGVGKVCGLPLPHAGPALYGVLPPAVLASSLRLVASLTVMLSRCLGIVLPHPILLRPLGIGGTGSSSSSKRSKARAAAALAHAQRKQCGDIVETVKVDGTNLENMLLTLHADEEHRNVEQDTLKVGAASVASNGSGNGNGAPDGASSQSLLSSASSIRTLGRTARWAFAKATGHSSSEGAVPTTSSSSIGASAPPSTRAATGTTPEAPPSYSNLTNAKHHHAPADMSTIAARIRHAAAAVIWEGADGTGGEYALIPPGWTGAPVRSSASSSSDGLSPDDEFATGLQLLQNDVVALCIRAGVQVSDMWPAEALLLNLHVLRIHLEKELKEEESS